MRVSNISAAGTVSQSGRHERETRYVRQERFRFSTAHIIVDLSPEAIRHAGLDPTLMVRPPRERLFVYDNSGAFAYDEPMQVDWTQRSAYPIMTSADDEDDIETEIGINETPPTTFVAFDGRLRSPARP